MKSIYKILFIILGTFPFSRCSKNNDQVVTPPPPPPVKDTVLKISNLLYSPDTIAIKYYDPFYTIVGTINFSGARGGVSKIKLATSMGSDTTLIVPGASGITQGTLTGTFQFIRPITPQDYTFEISVIDSKGFTSNRLSGKVAIIYDDRAKEWWSINSLGDPVMYKVAWLNDKYVSVGGARIETSKDGANWTKGTVQGETDFNLITLFGTTWTGSEYYAVGERNSLLASTDGNNWVVRNEGVITDGYLKSIAGSGNALVAVGNKGGYYAPKYPEILVSSDGNNWSDNIFSINILGGELRSVIWSGSQFVAVGEGRDGDHDFLLILTSPDGTNWTDRSIHSTWIALSDVIWTGSQFVAVGGNVIVTSSDGINWQLNTPGILQGAKSIIYNGVRYVVAGDNGIFVSDNLIAWHQTVQPNFSSLDQLKSIAWSPSNYNYVAVGLFFNRYMISP
jgi:hypothetical protein